MKKVLLATSALVAFAGAAAADVSLAGYARGGITVLEGDSTVINRVQLTFSGSVETDSGITAGAKTRIRVTNGGAGGTGANGGQVFFSSNGLTVQMGNIDGPIDGYGAGTLVGVAGGNFQGYVNTNDALAYTSNGVGANGVQASFSAGGLSMAAAYAEGAGDAGDDVTQVLVGYAAEGFAAAAGMQNGGAADELTFVHLGYTLNGISLNYWYGDDAGTVHQTVAVSGAVGAATKVTVYAADREGQANTGFGLGVNHNLGGAMLQAGYETRFNGNNYMEAGISFSF